MVDTLIQSPGYTESGQSRFYNIELQQLGRLDGSDVARTRILQLGDSSDLSLTDLNPILVKNPRFLRDPEIPTFALAKYIRTSFGSVPVYIFDNHNHAFFAWCEALAEGYLSRDTILHHIDDHLDGAVPWYLPPKRGSLIDIARYAQNLGINSFIYPAIHSNLAKSMIWYGNTDQWRKGQGVKYQFAQGISRYLPEFFREGDIFDLDMDYFATLDGDFNMPSDKETGILRDAMAQAGVVTIALSPEFVGDIHTAITTIKHLLR